ncbi:MAG: DMT family transporter [Oceanospirillaceae bacterium]
MFHITTLKTVAAPLNSGVLALIATLIMWASYFVALRSGAQSSLTGFDMALLRFLLPALLLLPVVIRSRHKILQVKKRYLMGIMFGAGLPFYLLSVLASGHVQAVIGSLLVPGVAPVFVTLLAVCCYKERLTKRRITGLSIVLAGIAVLLASTNSGYSEQSYFGYLFYILAALCWSTYTVSVKMAQLSGLELAAVLNSSAAVVLLLVMPTQYFSSNLMQAPLSVVLPQLVIMGFFCGLVTVVTYTHAINNLGAELSACWGALTPVLVSLMAFLILHESLDTPTIMAMVLITFGVICANFKRKRKFK